MAAYVIVRSKAVTLSFQKRELFQDLQLAGNRGKLSFCVNSLMMWGKQWLFRELFIEAVYIVAIT